MESSWFSFKDKMGVPFLFYNSETGEHRWANGYQHIQCSRANLDDVPPTRSDEEDIKIPTRKVKTYRSISTETEDHFSMVKSSVTTFKDAITSTFDLPHGDGTQKQNFTILHVKKGSCEESSTDIGSFIISNQSEYGSHDITTDDLADDEGTLTMDVKKEPSEESPTDVRSFTISNQSEYESQRINSPPRNPFCVDQPTDEAVDQDYVETKESLVHNLFAMELSSVLSEDDLSRNQGGAAGKYKSSPTPEMSKSDTSYSKTENNEARMSYLERSEEYFQTAKMGNEREIEMCSKDLEQTRTPPLLNIKLEPDSDEVKIPCDSSIRLEQTNDAYMNTDGYSIADLLPHQSNKHKTSNDLRKYKCSECNASFKRSADVRRHIIFVHQDSQAIPRPHACTLCGKTFVEANCLKKHMRTHTGEKPYLCPVCGKAFSQSQNLNKHKNIHTGTRPHKCKDCGKAFVQHSHLSRHKLIHTGEKPFQCGQCPKKYRTRSHLMRHFKSSNHRDVPIPSK